jgi:6-methylsalicylic acid synthase
MDPHHRLGLELAYEALKNAEMRPDGLAGSDTAVYIGVDFDNFSRMLLEDTYRRLRLPLWTLN